MLMALVAIYGDDLAEFGNKGGSTIPKFLVLAISAVELLWDGEF